MLQTRDPNVDEVACSMLREGALRIDVNASTSAGDVAAAIAAVATSGGGCVVLAPSDSDPASVAAVRRLIAEARELLRPRTVVGDVERVDDGERPVVVVHVVGRHRDHGPATVIEPDGTSKVYVRDGDRVEALTVADSLKLLRHAGLAPDELRPVVEQLAGPAIHPGRAGRVCAALGIAQGGFDDLRKLGAVEPWAPGWVFTVAGLVALAREPGSLLTAARILVRRLPGGVEEVDEVGMAPATSLYLNDGVEAALETLGDLLRPMKVYPGDRALREALVNAVSHRSYAPEHLGKPIIVEVHFDGVRISNPGGALARVGMVDSDGPTGAYRRNPRLHHLLKLLGLCEGQGLGVRQLREPDRKSGFFPAEFTSSSGTFSVLLRVDPDAKLGRRR